ncbi:hypothetical protein [Selenomonas sputigena]|uniref:hypothetical protein n=1 Tax=Selenomonas sputigena TaxID=69823 RepID=UPI00222E4492|nr:hypothetical protein [Selenomonas sputigena]UZD42770.1 hypothetical protein OL240_09500 [Selenomonas sputigena]
MKKRKYTGMEEAITEMPTHDQHRGLYIEVSYDLDNDEVLATPYVDYGMWSRTVYANPRIIRVGNFARRVSVEQLKKRIDEAVDIYLEYCA